MSINPIHLQQCLAQIEKALGWGSSENWGLTDFELLSEKILVKTGVSLSTSTLRRLWGKVKYDSQPQVATLNTLAKFLEFENFRAFVDSLDAEKTESTEYTDESKPNAPASSKSTSWNNRISTALIGIILVLLLGWQWMKTPTEVNYELKEFAFTSQPVSSGIPNSVVFEFDLSQATGDSIFIQQSWDSSKRTRLGKTQNQATSIYYYPGFFNAKLVLGEEVVQEHGLLIPTEGWLSLVVQEPVPFYVEPVPRLKGGKMGISELDLENANIPIQPELPISSFYYVKDFENFSSNSFSFETSFRNTYSKGNAACQFSQLVILTKTSPFVISMSIPGCSSELGVMLSEKMIEGSKNDLSAFGVDFSDWVNLRMEVKDKAVKIFLGSTAILEDSYLEDAGEIVGVAFHFEGTGEVDYVRLSDENGIKILDENF